MMKELHDELEIDVAAYCKHKINFKHKMNINGFNQLVKGGEVAIQSITAHNVQENVGKIQWREEGDRLIVCMDANEDIYRKLIGRSLTDKNGLNMSEVAGDFTGKKHGATFFCGSKPIDGVWATRDLNVTHACVMPAGFGVGDH